MKIKLLLIVLFPFIAFSQTENIETTKNVQHHYLSINYHNGTVLSSNDFVTGINESGIPIEDYQSVSLKFGWQNPGYKDWQQVHRGLFLGGGIFFGTFKRKEDLGNPIALYGIIGLPIWRYKRLDIYTEGQFGVTGHWSKYDAESNPLNIAIGSTFTVFLDAGINAFYAVTPHFDLGLGYSFTHFSNGGTQRPNHGLNLLSPSLELKYRFQEKPDYKNIPYPPEDMKQSNDLYIMLATGQHQMVAHEFDTVTRYHYGFIGLGLFYNIQHGNAFRSGFGTDIDFMRYLTAEPDGTKGPVTFDNMTIGLAYAPQVIIDNFTIVGSFGVYAKHKYHGNFKKTYQRVGFRYRFENNFSVGFNVRSVNFYFAEFLEFHLGYTIRWFKN
ncbi:MAG: acyloxyacyl hydrolase [Bacteroidota bacterium]